QVLTRPQMTFAVSDQNLVPIGPQNLQPPYSVPCPTVILQRLACPYLPHNPMPGDQEQNLPTNQSYNSGLPLNPYITIDYFGNVNRETNPAINAKRVIYVTKDNKKASADKPAANGKSEGRREPFAGHDSQKFPTTTKERNTF